jgi:TonB-linked SusC/RagA family outer membrane protein
MVNRRLTSLVSAVAFALLAFAGSVAAQDTGVITGQVTDAQTGQPLVGAQIFVEGTTIGTLTNDSGRYRIQSVPTGARRVRAVLLGFGPITQDVNISGGETVVVDFQLAQTAIALDEVVITATGEQRKRELGNVIGTIDAAERIEIAPVTNAFDLLQSQTAGVNVVNAGGTTGQGSRIRIRGANSISLSNDPIVYVDGVRVESSSSNMSFYVGGGQDPGRLNDINPEDIESVEIVKGPSAATLYGTQAANGVILITTKRGQAGAPRWTFYAEGGLVQDPYTYPDNWESRGPSGEFCRIDRRANGRCPSVANTYNYTVLEDDRYSPYEDGFRQQYGLNISGGTERVNYYVSSEWENENGPYKLPDYYANQLEEGGFEVNETTDRPQQVTRVNIRANLTAQIAETATLALRTGYLSSNLSFTSNDNSSYGFLPSGYFGGARRPESADDDSGAWGFQDPAQLFHRDVFQNVERFTTSGNLNWTPLTWLAVRGTVGVDFTNRHDISHIPRGLVPGTITGSRSSNYRQIFQYTADFGATGTFDITNAVRSKTAIGVQYLRDYFTGTNTSGSDIVTGSKSQASAAITSANEVTVESRTLGYYIEQTFSWNDNIFVTGAVRLDDNSSFGKNYDAALYPKFSLSWLMSEENWFPTWDWMEEFRIRGAWGKSGLQPGTTDAIRTLNAVAYTSAADGSSSSGVTIDNIGNAELKPESSAEFETGLDMGFLSGRLGWELTYYQKETEDALIERDLPPSLGAGDTRWENLGSVKNSGWETLISASLVQADNWSWDLSLSGSINDNEVVELGEGIEPIGSTLRFVEGFPAGGYWDQPYTYNDDNGDGIISVDELNVADTAEFVNRSLPGQEASISTTFNLFNSVRVYGLFDYRGDFVLYNNTERFRCRFSVCSAVMNPDAPLDDQARAVAQGYHPSQTIYGYLEDASFWKFRELSVSWTMPEEWSALWRTSRTVLTVTGRNLMTWTDYTGMDPELNSTGAGSNFGNSDFLTQPPVRYWSARLTLNF